MMHGARHDLLTAPGRLVEGIQSLGTQAHVVRYEKLVTEPEGVLRPLFEWLELDYEPGLVDYGGGDGDLPRWELADQKRVYSERRPVSDGLNGWQKQLQHSQFWRLASDYRQALGPEIWQGLGYDPAAVDEQLAAARPVSWRRQTAVSLYWLLSRPPDDRSRLERARVKLARWANRAADDAESATS